MQVLRLIEKETIEGDEFRRIVSEYAELPEKQKCAINLEKKGWGLS